MPQHRKKHKRTWNVDGRSDRNKPTGDESGCVRNSTESNEPRPKRSKRLKNSKSSWRAPGRSGSAMHTVRRAKPRKRSLTALPSCLILAQRNISIVFAVLSPGVVPRLQSQQLFSYPPSLHTLWASCHSRSNTRRPVLRPRPY